MPAGSMAAASTRLYASEIHCRSEKEACREVAIVGRARLSTVRSSPTTSTLAAIAISAHHLRAGLSAMTVTSLRQQQLNESYCQKYVSAIWLCQPKIKTGAQILCPLSLPGLAACSALQPGQQRRAVRDAEAGAGVPARSGRVGAVVPAGDVAEAGHIRAGRHARVHERLQQAEPLAAGLR